jgi:spermidine synthase
MGFSFSITQVVLVREMLVSFSGNELSISLMLGWWLLLEAAGSFTAGKLAGRVGDAQCAYARLQAAFALVLVPELMLALALRRLLGAVPGEGLGLGTMALASLVLLLPMGLIDGAMFAVGCRMDDAYRGHTPSSARHVYVLEAIGGIAGGLVCTYWLIPRMQSLQVGLLIAALNAASALSLSMLPPLTSPCGRLVASGWRRALPFGALLAACLGLLFSPACKRLEHGLSASSWPGFELVFSANSGYGNVAAIRRGEQTTFLADGVPVLSAPVPDITSTEEIVHFPLLFVARPRRVLVLGGGLGGVIAELLKYHLERVDYAELDPLLIEAVRALPTALTQAELADPRLTVERIDGRLLVRRLSAAARARLAAAQGGYDLILVNLPYPTTLQLNRFYTEEFWAMARGLLARDGVVAFALPGSLSYLSPGMRDLHRALANTLSRVFAHVRPIPDDLTLWLASPEVPLEAMGADELVAHWEAAGVPTKLVSPAHVRLKLDERSLKWYLDSLMLGRGSTVNSDLRPAGVLYGLAHWAEVFSPGTQSYLALLGRLNLAELLAPVFLLTGVALAVTMLGRPWRPGPLPTVIATSGFAGMCADLLIIFAFQALYGYVYHLIGLLLAAFMAGLSLGGWMAGRGERLRGDEGGATQDGVRLLRLEAAMLVFWLVLPLVLTGLQRVAETGYAAAEVTVALVTLNALVGSLVGAQFTTANRMSLHAHPDAVATAGSLYAADLVGAFSAAMSLSAMLLPALGMVQICVLVAGVKAGSFLMAWAMRRKRTICPADGLTRS